MNYRYDFFVLLVVLFTSCNSNHKSDGLVDNSPVHLYDQIYVGDPISKFDSIYPNKVDTLSGLQIKIFPLADSMEKIDALMIFGNPQDYNGVKSYIESEVKLFHSSISTKYGDPTVTNHYPLWIEIHEEEVYPIYLWTLEEKGISIGIQKINDRFLSNVFISSNSHKDRIRVQNNINAVEGSLKF